MVITPQKQLDRMRNYIKTPKGREMKKRTQLAYRTRLRDSVIGILGNKCGQCGFADKRALHVDHINGGGNKERKEISSVPKYYRTIIESVLSEENKYQLLCANCNMIKKVINKE